MHLLLPISKNLPIFAKHVDTPYLIVNMKDGDSKNLKTNNKRA